MTDAQHEIDWDAVRRAASDCHDATWSLMCFAEWSQESDYDTQRAAAHLAAIDRACGIFRPAMEVLQPGLGFAGGDDSLRYSPVFDALALATASQSERPDFRYGPVCCATAHEAAFELLRWAILRIEDGLNDELDDRGLPDECVASIDDLHKLSSEELRDTLVRLETKKSLQKLVNGRGSRQISAWIDKEWAAAKANQPASHKAGATANAGGKQRKRKGRKKADYKIVQKEAAIVESWKKAHQDKVYKSDWAKDNGMTVKQLDAILDRVYQRNRRSDK